MVLRAGIFPAELTALRSFGLLMAIFLIAYAVLRRRSLRNADVLILIAAGLVLLGLRRRWWELVVLATPILLVTAIGAASLAAPRRNEVLMTLVFPLAALALSSGLAAIFSGRKWSPEQASSQPS